MAQPKDLNYWLSRRRYIRTSIGKWIGGDDIQVRGKWLLKELLNDISSTQLMVLNITGRLISRELAAWLDKVVFFTSYPDHRIWCNQIGALAGNTQASPVAAAAAGTLAADSRAYGSKIQALTIRTLEQLYRRYRSGESLSALVAEFPVRNGIPSISGFARPVKVADERLAPMKHFTSELGLETGAYVAFAETFAAYLREHHDADMNAAAYVCAFLRDQGFTATEVYRIRTSDVLSGVMACYTDLYGRASHSFLPQYCCDIEYQGPAPRALP